MLVVREERDGNRRCSKISQRSDQREDSGRSDGLKFSRKAGKVAYIKMDGFEAYKMYLAVSNHFRSKSYDYFKYNGSVKAKASSYEVRKDKYFFEKASRVFKHDDFLKYLVSNMCYSTDWIGNLLGGKQQIQYKKWKQHTESLTYNFKEEIEHLYDIEENVDSLFRMEEGKHPLLYRLYLRHKVSLETLVLLDDLVGYSKVWSRADDMMLDEAIMLIGKYRPFLFHFTKPSKKKLRETVLEIYK
jgi:hypothetical protein